MKSFYEITFLDGSKLHSDSTNWLNHAEKVVATQGKNSRIVYANILPIHSLLVHHNGLEKIVVLSDESRVFQSVSARTTFTQDKDMNEIIGRTIGIIINGDITEEYFLNGELNEIVGFKYNNG